MKQDPGRCGKAPDRMRQTGDSSRTADLEAKFSKAQTRPNKISASLERVEYNSPRESSQEAVRQACRHSMRLEHLFWYC